jgi:4-hydroxybenzoate polyprenyltransferase
MFASLKGFAQFISVERGVMLFAISVAATFLILGSLAWIQAIFLGAIVFCLWSGLDALNNFFDVNLDAISDSSRSKYTKSLGKIGICVAVLFCALSLVLGASTMIPVVVLFTALGILFGVLYSAPPFRLRQTVYKPLVNFTVGAVPVLIVAAFCRVFSVNVMTLVFFIGVTTSVNSLWEDLADYESDSTSGARTVPIVFGVRKGLFFTLAMGYSMIPMMILVGILFQMHLTYYLILAGLTVFISARIYQKRSALQDSHRTDTGKLLEIGGVFSRDFVVVAIVETLGLMLTSLLTIGHFLPI